MKRILSLALGIGILTLGIGAVAQSDIDVFPLGTTTMIYNVTSEDMTGSQTLELVVT